MDIKRDIELLGNIFTTLLSASKVYTMVMPCLVLCKSYSHLCSIKEFHTYGGVRIS
jgi:hypothetical protein